MAHGLADALTPERRKMMEYLTAHADGMTDAQIIARVHSAVGEFEAALDGVSADDARRPGPAGGWNIAHVVDHLAQTQIRAAEELRWLLEGHRPPGPPVYDGLISGGALWAPWSDLVHGLRAANAEFERVLARVVETAPTTGATARTVLVVNTSTPEGGVGPDIFEAPLAWKGYALVQRLHLLDHRTQVRNLRGQASSKERHGDSR
jgi:hypothetical protein